MMLVELEANGPVVGNGPLVGNGYDLTMARVGDQHSVTEDRKLSGAEIHGLVQHDECLACRLLL